MKIVYEVVFLWNKVEYTVYDRYMSIYSAQSIAGKLRAEKLNYKSGCCQENLKTSFFGSWSPVGIKICRVCSNHTHIWYVTWPQLKTSKNSDWVDRFRNITIRFAKTRHYLQLVACVWGNVQYFENYRSLRGYKSTLAMKATFFFCSKTYH